MLRLRLRLLHLYLLLWIIVGLLWRIVGLLLGLLGLRRLRPGSRARVRGMHEGRSGAPPHAPALPGGPQAVLQWQCRLRAAKVMQLARQER